MYLTVGNLPNSFVLRRQFQHLWHASASINLSHDLILSSLNRRYFGTPVHFMGAILWRFLFLFSYAYLCWACTPVWGCQLFPEVEIRKVESCPACVPTTELRSSVRTGSTHSWAVVSSAPIKEVLRTTIFFYYRWHNRRSWELEKTQKSCILHPGEDLEADFFLSK